MEKRIALGTNLKRLREQRGMTQRQLADAIGYSEKSISKWESGGGLPTLEMTVLLAQVLGVSTDRLLFGVNEKKYLLGIDGGGTKTVFRLTDESGAEVKTVYRGPSNPNDIGMKNAQALLREGIEEVCGTAPYAQIALFAGISGGGLTGNNAAELKEFFGSFGFYAFGNGSDIENLMALADAQRCILVIMGTGFIVYVLCAGEQRRIAGWGQFFDEGGSGYTLGRDAICSALRAHDGSGRKTALEQMLKDKMGESVADHLAKIYAGGKRYIASFASVVFDAAQQCDGAAQEILEKNMAFTAEMIHAAARDIPGSERIPVLFSGSVVKRSEVLFPIIRRHLPDGRCKLEVIEKEPVEGALRRAGQILERTEGKRR